MNNIPTEDEIDLSKIITSEELLELASEGKLKLAQLKALIAIHPGIVQTTINTLEAFTKSSENAGNSQVEAVKGIRDSINGSLEVLKILAQKSQSDGTIEKIASTLLEVSKLHKEISLILEKMNNSNNKLWKKVFVGIGTVATLVVGGVAYAATLRKK
jgi:hypothetical protein